MRNQRAARIVMPLERTPHGPAYHVGQLNEVPISLLVPPLVPAGGRPVESLTGRRGFDGAAVVGCGWISSARSVRIFHDAFAF